MVRRLRLVSGLILFAYIATHFVNHSLGIVSIGAMEMMLWVIYPFWSYPPVTIVLYGALIVHMTLALYALWQRRSLKIPFNEAAQYVLGFSVPLLLAEHVTNTRIDAAFYGGDFGHYRYLLSALWYGNPRQAYIQMALLFAAWVHACIGLRFWLRLQPWYEPMQPLLFAAALLLPVLALLGFIAGGREIGVVMLADAVESASRTLTDPAPGSLQKLVHDLLMKRLLEGQFEECALTLSEIHSIEASLVKSVIALYHARIRYPEGKTRPIAS